MSMGYGELEANDINKPSSQSLPRKTISLKLKRESLEAPVREDEYESPKKKERQEEMRPQDEELNWNFKVKLAAEKKTNILNMCEKCKKPILVHGRLIPCKHFLCLSCAQGGTRTCFKCNKEIIGIQPVPTIYVCTSDGTRHSVTGCRKSYLNLRGLAQHQTLRHGERPGDPNLDSDGELSVNQPPAAPEPAPVPQASLPPSLPPSLPTPPSFPRPMLLPSLTNVTSASMFSQSAAPAPHLIQTQRMQIPISAAPPMSVISMPRASLPYPTPVSQMSPVNPQTLMTARSLAPQMMPPQIITPLALPGMLPRPEFKQFMLPHLKPPFLAGPLPGGPPPGFPQMPSQPMPGNMSSNMPTMPNSMPNNMPSQPMPANMSNIPPQSMPGNMPSQPMPANMANLDMMPPPPPPRPPAPQPQVVNQAPQQVHQTRDIPQVHQTRDIPQVHQSRDIPKVHQSRDIPQQVEHQPVQPQVYQAPRDPRKMARDIPPPPPPKTGPVR